MTKRERIEHLEQEVARLNSEIIQLRLDFAQRPAYPIPVYPQPPWIPTWTQPNTIWPYAITSYTVETPQVRHTLTYN